MALVERKRGPDPERLKIESEDWEDALRRAAQKPKPEKDQAVRDEDSDESEDEP